ncbi:hypothetical protein IB232_23085 [Pseudomonas sp. PDM15]|uniref:DUF6388 family protein n=1 Tax=Pseudomonas sp. PDM15 TaxID=2769303 RepID=UPI00177F8857|nr:DUF6388 family protein [Pseudomonas sp. PDM15]MBD9428224.1 hypothetical protein [Pseudomonas sp. PDM15]
MDFEQLYRAAIDKFLDQNPKVLEYIESGCRSVRALSYMPENEFREQQRRVCFALAAQTYGIDVDELVIRLMAESPEQAQEWRMDGHRKLDDVFGMLWDEYKQRNRIFE